MSQNIEFRILAALMLLQMNLRELAKALSTNWSITIPLHALILTGDIERSPDTPGLSADDIVYRITPTGRARYRREFVVSFVVSFVGDFDAILGSPT